MNDAANNSPDNPDNRLSTRECSAYAIESPIVLAQVQTVVQETILLGKPIAMIMMRRLTVPRSRREFRLDLLIAPPSNAYSIKWPVPNYYLGRGHVKKAYKI